MKLNLDKIDLRILRILQERGRITNIMLSQEIGLSPAPTLERVKKLENSGLLKSYHAHVDKELLGLGLTALIQVSLARQRENAIQKFIAKINEIPAITECYQVTGDFDFQLKIIVEDISSFEHLISDKLSRIEEIGNMKSMVVLNKVKDSKVLPINYE